MMFRLTRKKLQGRSELVQAIVRAAGETMARQVLAGGEGESDWLDTEATTCETVEPNGPPEIIAMEFDS